MPVHVVEHPLIKHKLGIMREHDITTKDFRDLASEIATLLTYEATKDLAIENRVVKGWAGEIIVERIKGKKIYRGPYFKGRSRDDGRGAEADSFGQGQCGRILPE